MGRVGTFSTTLQRKGLGKGGKRERERGDEILKDFHGSVRLLAALPIWLPS